MPKFKHEPLVDPAKQIRLLRFSDIDGPEDLNLELTHFEQCSAPPYIALSYEWGEADPDIDVPITVNGKQLAVRYNLQDFLHVLVSKVRTRRLHTDLWYWADAICIDQSTVSERNAQVSIMDQIYTSAQEVFAWLGRLAFVNETSMCGFIKTNRNLMQNKFAVELQNMAKPDSRHLTDLQDLLTLCKASYWSRRWIAVSVVRTLRETHTFEEPECFLLSRSRSSLLVPHSTANLQELYHARKVAVCWNDTELAWESLGALLGPHHQIAGPATTDIGLEPAAKLWSSLVQCNPAKLAALMNEYGTRSKEQTTLMSILELFKNSMCSHPNDRLFSLLSMTQERPYVHVDYQLDLHDLIIRVFMELELKAGLGIDLRRLHELLCDESQSCGKLWDHARGVARLSLSKKTTIVRVLKLRAGDHPGMICETICRARRKVFANMGQAAGDLVRIEESDLDIGPSSLEQIGGDTESCEELIDCGQRLIRCMVLSCLRSGTFYSEPKSWRRGFSPKYPKHRLDYVNGDDHLARLNGGRGWVAVCTDGSICVASCSMQSGDEIFYDASAPKSPHKLLVLRSSEGRYNAAGTAVMVVTSSGHFGCSHLENLVPDCQCSETRQLPHEQNAFSQPSNQQEVSKPCINVSVGDPNTYKISLDMDVHRMVGFTMRYNESASARQAAIHEWQQSLATDNYDRRHASHESAAPSYLNDCKGWKWLSSSSSSSLPVDEPWLRSSRTERVSKAHGGQF